MPTLPEPYIFPHIVATPETCGGRPRIEESRIAVADIAAWMKRGVSLDDIAGYYPWLQPAQIHAAATYYFDNKPTIDNDLREQEHLYNEGLLQQQQREELPA
jgi:uncharacterized protein (DUF433 family)